MARPVYVTIAQYFMAHFKAFSELPLAQRKQLTANAETLLARVNKLCNILVEKGGISLATHPKTSYIFSSAWRPASYNTTIRGAAVNSKHVTAQAIDLYDPDGDIDEWLLDNAQALEQVQLWLEHPAATKGWSHVQTVPPRSGKRIFYP